MIDEQWKKVRDEVFLRDQGRCQILANFPSHIIAILANRAPKNLLYIIDPAHILSRSSRPDLKYEQDNIILLNRFSHSCIDYMLNPITGKPINKEEHEAWWIKIVGQERWDRLTNKGDSYE